MLDLKIYPYQAVSVDGTESCDHNLNKCQINTDKIETLNTNKC